MKAVENFFALPALQSEVDRQIAQVLRLVLGFFGVMSLLYALLSSLADFQNWDRYAAQGGFLLSGMFLGLFFLRKGYVRSVAIFVTLVIWLVFTAAAFTGGGVRSSGYFGYLVVLVVAGVLSGKQFDTLLVTLLCLGAGYYMVYAEMNGTLPRPAVPMTAFALWLDSLFYFAIVASLLFLTMRVTYSALQRLNHELLERQQTEQRAAQVAGQLATLNEIGRAVSEVTDLRVVLEIIRQKLAQLLAFDFYSVRVFNAEARIVTFLAVYENGRYWDEADAPLVPGTDTYTVFQTGEPVLHLYTEEELENYKRAPVMQIGDRTQFTASVIFVPLKKREQTVGTLSVQSYQRNAYTQEHLKLVEAVAIQVGIAIENARLFTNLQHELAERKQAEELTRQVNFQLQRHIKELYALNAVSQAGASAEDEHELLESVVETLFRSLYPDIVGVALWDEEEQVLRTSPCANRGLLNRLSQSQMTARLNEGVVGKVAATRQPYRIKNTDDPYYLSIDPSIYSELCVPILAGEKLIGVLDIESRQPDAFSDADENLLLTVAGQLASAIERLRAEQELRSLNALLEQRVSERTAQLEMANKELESFSYSISHDLRAPLRSINGFAKILGADFSHELTPQASEFLKKIINAGGQMAQMIDALLDFSRIGRKPLNLQVVDVNELIKNVIESLAAETEGRQIEWILKKVPPAKADPTLLRLVYTNLISNAIKYTSTRQVARIELGSLEQGREMVYFVRDNGVGFDMQYVDKLFGVFHRLHREDEFEGTGIGLATVQRIINRHGGRIWAEAEVQNGAIFFSLQLEKGRRRMGKGSSFGMADILLSQDVARYLRTILWFFLFFLMLGGLANFISPGEMNIRIVARNSIAMAGITAICLLLLRANRTSTAILLMIVGCGAILFWAAWNGTGIRGPAFVAFILIVLGISLYWGQRAGLWAALVTAGMGLILLFAELFDWLPHISRSLEGWFVWGFLTAIFFLSSLMLGLMLRYLERLVTQLRQEQEKIGRLNAELEERVAERTAQLAESQRLLDIISRNIQDVVWIADLRLRTRYISASGARLLGYAPEEILRIPLRHVLTPESFALAQQTLQEELKQESDGSANPYRSRMLQLEYVRKDGSLLRVEVRASFLRDEQGHPIGLTGINRDITERRWMEKALLESEERYRKITSVVSDYIYSAKVDAQGQFSPEWVAGAFDEITGYAFDEYLAAGGWEILRHPDSIPQDELDRQSLTENRPLEGSVLKIRCKDGQIRWVRNFAYPVWNREENRLAGVYGAVQDITFQKEYEERLKSLNEELERRVAERTTKLENALSELESFSYSISHDLRAPLRAVNGYAGILLAEYKRDFPPDVVKRLESIKENGQRMGQLVDGLLEFLHSGRAPVERQLVDLGEIVRSVLDRMQTKLENRQVEIHIQVLPPCSANARLLDKVYEGLISNAIKFTRHCEKAMIEIGGLEKDGTQVYFVCDNGVGFDMKYYDKLFGVFQRLHHMNEFDGIGVSLAIVQRIINRHGGRIWAESAVGKGATFYFTLGG